MAAPDYALTKDMLAAMLQVTRIESERMVDALHDVLVLGKRPSPTAEFYGIKRQQLETRVTHVLALKPAFDKYATLVQNGHAVGD
jgi:hypothetical protein